MSDTHTVDPPTATGSSDVPPVVPARMVNELVYCPRLMYLEWVQGEFRHNAFTVEGSMVHARADRPGGRLPEPSTGDGATGDGATGDGAVDGDTPDDEDDASRARSVWLTSERLHLTAKIDIVDAAGGRVMPVEYKRGSAPDIAEGAYLPERVQLCAQVLLLREHGYQCDEAAIYFAGDRRRVPIAIDAELIATTLEAVDRARTLASRPEPPKPLDNSPKCRGCSLVSICLPDELAYLQRQQAEDSGTLPPSRVPAEAPLRRLHPARTDALPLYVQEHGARVGVSGRCLQVRSRSGERVEARIPHTSQVSLFGYAQITTQALHALFRSQIPVSFFTGGGWYVGQASAVGSNNVELRIAQYRAADDPRRCLRIARTLIASKIANSRTLLRRNSDDADEVALRTLRRHARKAERATAIAELLGIEGSAARAYFGAFRAMLKGPDADELASAFERRTRRPPRDPLNALLSFAYALLTKDVTLALSAVGLDPMRGFYHQIRFGRPSLALDLMEEFRPLVADSVVVSAINNGVVGVGDFDHSPVGVTIRAAARKRFIRAYERRMDQLITHPVFGYRICYRRVLEVQARLLGRWVTGETARYPAFNTR